MVEYSESILLVVHFAYYTIFLSFFFFLYLRLIKVHAIETNVFDNLLRNGNKCRERLFPLDKLSSTKIIVRTNMYALTRGAIYNLHLESTNQPTERKNLAI